MVTKDKQWCIFKVLRLPTTQNKPQTSNSLLSPIKSMVACRTMALQHSFHFPTMALHYHVTHFTSSPWHCITHSFAPNVPLCAPSILHCTLRTPLCTLHTLCTAHSAPLCALCMPLHAILHCTSLWPLHTVCTLCISSMQSLQSLCALCTFHMPSVAHHGLSMYLYAISALVCTLCTLSTFLETSDWPMVPTIANDITDIRTLFT